MTFEATINHRKLFLQCDERPVYTMFFRGQALRNPAITNTPRCAEWGEAIEYSNFHYTAPGFIIECGKRDVYGVVIYVGGKWVEKHVHTSEFKLV